ncbi:MAG: hypothetical protein QNJ12_05585 [Ilumatobacter sp.]|uniref:hypothetical protein n=1 Tax=Ilumatobacter sp. TaxID=1967498 RepID=UPI00260B6F47|nr:hypothetical protein [Ilumatobacter sp.]MDJ0768242.1 hypothetical protein [Ilumatobacter sp.]
MRRTLVLLVAASLLAVSCGDDTPDEAEFRIQTDPVMPGGDETTSFSATGEAVDEGMLCPDGASTWVQTLHADTGLPESPADPPRDGEVVWVEHRLTCADGSGDFVLRADALVDFAELDSAIATGDPLSEHPLSVIEGSGDYVELDVDGTREWSVVTPGGVDDGFYEVFTGTLSLG